MHKNLQAVIIAHMPPQPYIYIYHVKTGSGVFAYKYRRACLRSCRVHNREQNNSPKSGKALRHLKKHRTQGSHRKAANGQSRPVFRGSAGAGSQQGRAPHQRRHGYKAEVQGNIKHRRAKVLAFALRCLNKKRSGGCRFFLL